MRKYRVLALAMAMVAAVCVGAYAQDDEIKAEGNVVDVTVLGKPYDVLAALKKAGIEIEADGAQPALRVSEAKDADGAVIETLKGVTLFYVADAKGKEVAQITDKDVAIKGKLFKKQNLLLINEIQADTTAAAASDDEEFQPADVGSASAGGVQEDEFAGFGDEDEEGSEEGI